MQVVFQDPFGSLSARTTIEQIVGEGVELHMPAFPDAARRLRTLDMLVELQHKYGMSHVFISHDLALIRAMAHRVLVMKDGEIIEQREA
jgi:ABC-type microcin C transport system duplicated ATPase subunit YejF